MITVNLLPHDLRPIKRTPLPYIGSGLVLVLVLAAVGFVFVVTQSKVSTARRTLAENQRSLDELRPVLDRWNELVDRKAALEIQAQAIEEIARDRLIWSQVLADLSRLTIDNLWYSKIGIASKQVTETEFVENPATKKLEPQLKQVTLRVLRLEGYVIPGPEGSNATTPFLDKLSQDERFSSMFEIESPDVSDGVFENQAVRQFKFDYRLTGSGVTP